MNVFHLRPVVTLKTTHDLYDAMNRHIGQLKTHLDNEPLSEDGTFIQGQMDLLWFFCDVFFASYENATAHDFADYMYALSLGIGRRSEDLAKSEGLE